MEFSKLVKQMVRNVKDLARLPPDEDPKKEKTPLKNDEEMQKENSALNKTRIWDINHSKLHIYLIFIEMVTIVELVTAYSTINKEIIGKQLERVNFYFVEITKILESVQQTLNKITVSSSDKSKQL